MGDVVLEPRVTLCTVPVFHALGDVDDGAGGEGDCMIIIANRLVTKVLRAASYLDQKMGQLLVRFAGLFYP